MVFQESIDIIDSSDITIEMLDADKSLHIYTQIQSRSTGLRIPAGLNASDPYLLADALNNKAYLVFGVSWMPKPSRQWRAIELQHKEQLRGLTPLSLLYTVSYSIKEPVSSTPWFKSKQDIAEYLTRFGFWACGSGHLGIDAIRQLKESGEVFPVIYWGGKGYGKLRHISVSLIEEGVGLPERGEPDTLYYLQVHETPRNTERTYRLDRLQLVAPELAGELAFSINKRTKLFSSEIKEDESRKNREKQTGRTQKPLVKCSNERRVIDRFTPVSLMMLPGSDIIRWSYEKDYIQCDDGYTYSLRHGHNCWHAYRFLHVRPELSLAYAVYWDQLVSSLQISCTDQYSTRIVRTKKVCMEALLEGKLYFPASSESAKKSIEASMVKRQDESYEPFSISWYRRRDVSPGLLGIASLKKPW